MSDDSRTELKLTIPGLDLAISGDKRFVEDLYQQITRDILPLVVGGRGEQAAAHTTGSFTWVYRCTDIYSKVYAVDDDRLRRSPVARSVDPARLRRIYVERSDLGTFEAMEVDEVTLWAELTEEGKRLTQGDCPV